VDLQVEAYGKEKNIPPKLFDILKEQRQELTALTEKFGPIVTPQQLEEG
jgi:phosphoenolpyruvate carboxykinase (GTP)